MEENKQEAKFPTAHARDAQDILKELRVDPKAGLDNAGVEESREKYGPNVLPEKEGTSVLMLFLKQFKDFLILILLIAAGIAFFGGQTIDGYIILAVILFNATMGFVQEYKAEKAVQAIKSMVKHKVTVLRNGEKETVDTADVVMGEILLLEEGQSVPADARLLAAKNLRTGEASLTGESEPVDKGTKQLEEDTGLGDRSNMVWKGTNVVKGSGKAVVTAIGELTELGKIARSLQEMATTKSNFRRKTATLAKKMAAIAFITASIIFCIGYFIRDFNFQEIIMVTIAELVSAIPEGLPVVISIVLAIGANRMAKKNAIIREFTATEVMGSITTILSDKTGTITQSILTVKRIFGGDKKEFEVSGQGYGLDGEIEQDGKAVDIKGAGEALKRNLAIARYGTNAAIKGQEGAEGDEGMDDRKENGEGAKDGNNDELQPSGDPTEIALLILGKKSGIHKIGPYGKMEELDDIPFSSEQKYRAKLVRTADGKKWLLVVGALEQVLEMSSRVFTEDGPTALKDDFREAIQNKNDEWAEKAYRVLALAYKEMEDGADRIREDDVAELAWTGIVGMIDPPRPKVKEAIADCKSAGIRVIMITGDHAKTAAAIAREVGILDNGVSGKNGDYPEALTERDITEAGDEKLDDMIRHVSVFARVSPATKLRIAERLQESGELIAMTGDGVNDAPALKKADVGIAMGQKGTDVAKDAAQIVLSDDNFASIVNAIREGRIVFRNVKQTSYFLLTTNFASATTLITAISLGFPIPLTAVQILWVNMVTDGVMDVALATEPGHGKIMEHKPIRKNEHILKWEVVPFLLIMAAIMVVLAVLTFRYYLPEGIEVARTGTFFVISATQIFNVFNMRNIEESVFSIGMLSNKWINIAFVASFVLQLAVVKIPWLQDIFGFDDIAYLDFLVIVLLSTSVLWAGELYKLLKRKRN